MFIRALALTSRITKRLSPRRSSPGRDRLDHAYEREKRMRMGPKTLKLEIQDRPRKRALVRRQKPSASTVIAQATADLEGYKYIGSIVQRKAKSERKTRTS